MRFLKIGSPEELNREQKIRILEDAVAVGIGAEQGGRKLGEILLSAKKRGLIINKLVVRPLLKDAIVLSEDGISQEVKLAILREANSLNGIRNSTAGLEHLRRFALEQYSLIIGEQLMRRITQGRVVPPLSTLTDSVVYGHMWCSSLRPHRTSRRTLSFSPRTY